MSTSSASLSDTGALHVRVQKSIELAVNYAWETRNSDHHWMGELKSCPNITAQHIFFHQSLGIPISDPNAYIRYLFSEQRPDGSWSIAPDYPGDINTSAEVYLALKILGIAVDNPAMERGRSFIEQCGGIAHVRVFTRIFFAQFGLFPWSAVPELPAEFILLPSVLPINIYRMASWARSTLVPLLIIRHHEKVYALPNGLSANNTFLDELWLEPGKIPAPYSPSILSPWKSDTISHFFSTVDSALSLLGKIRPLWILRSLARKKCIQWILEHQEKEGDWAGIIPPMHAGVQALLLEGRTLHDDCIRRALDAIERFTWVDGQGKRLQACISPVWDTVLMTRALCDARDIQGAGSEKYSQRLRETVEWIKSKQILGREGDWRVFSQAVEPGGFSFEYNNTWYPDVDDTAAAILSIISHNPVEVGRWRVAKAATWICGMQNRDGGWAAFDINNDKLWLNKIPFSDMDSLCDPSTADVTGRVLEAFGMMTSMAETEDIEPQLLGKISFACSRAIGYLAEQQEPSGAWYGRWGCNYIYGTSNVVCGLVYFSDGDCQVQDMLSAGISWIKQIQNQDGGWGEELQSYRDPSRAGQGPSTASQTAWCLMALLAASDHRERAVVDGVKHLVRGQVDVEGNGASWLERTYTGTGFPNHFYIGYSLYRHYFPLTALSRYMMAIEGSSPSICSSQTNNSMSCLVDSGYSERSTSPSKFDQ